MKTIIKSILVFISLLIYSGCDVDYFDNPNAPQSPPTSALLNENLKNMVDDFRDQWFGGRFTQVTMQYWTQSEYGDEDRYVYRESQRQTWEEFYWNLENIRKVIQFNTDEETKADAAAYGDNENQIAVARIIMAWSFNVMADTWGDIPYYSYGSDDADFQALKLADSDDAIRSPKYASQEKIYADILKELDEAAEMIDVNAPGVQGDNVYQGDMSKWIKFANSLRLRVALKIRGVNATLANTHITDAQAAGSGGIFTSNADNAVFTYEATDANAAPYYVAFNVDNRRDFAMGHSFITLLKGANLRDTNEVDISSNPFGGMVDPRLYIYAQNSDTSIVSADTVFYGSDTIAFAMDSVYLGMPVVEGSDEAATIRFESLPGDAIINTPDYGEVLMEYAEVQFILSELNGWNQTNYENGVKASMEKWGVEAAVIDDYVNQLPAANQENVLTQKYIALYMDPHTAWAEYRRTGYPQTLVMPNDNFLLTAPLKKEKVDRKFVFTPLVEGITDIPNRMRYPQFEQTLNGENRKEAVDKLANGDAIDSPLWWDN